MDPTPNNPDVESEFSLNNLSCFYTKVFMKKELEEENSGECEKEVQPNSLNPIPSKRLHDEFRIVKGPNNERRYGCKQCEFNTKHKVSLYRHVKLHNPEHMTSYRCQICGFETLYRRHLAVHVKVLHEKESKTKLYKCDQCSYACNYRENLSRHKKIHLAPEERVSFVCDICGFETFYRKSYRVHMEMIHPILAKNDKNEEAEYKCYHCPFETKYRVNIIRHLKTHMKGDTTIYKCKDCDFQTIHKTNFNTHVLRHKDPSKIKIFECQHCSHKTFYKASLRNHLKLHMKKEEIEMYKCDICDFATIYERSLKLHVLYMHNGDHQAIEYFKCHFCDFETRYRENWRRHEKGHTKPGKQDTYNCAECSFSTIQQGRYERHLLAHASPEELVTLDRSEKKSEGNKRFRAVIDTPNTNIEFTLTRQSDNFKSQTFTDGKSKKLTMFQCGQCSYKTLNKQMLDDHLGTHHVVVDKNNSVRVDRTACMSSMELSDTLTKESDKKNSLNDNSKYLNVKTRKIIFDCQYCPFTTIHQGSIRRHRETHLRPNERKEYKCPTCIFRSFTRARVNSHDCPNRSKNVVLE